jgi:hypothetical protein
MSKPHAAPEHAAAVRSYLEAHGLPHLRARKYGQLVIIESGPEADPIAHATRLRRDTVHLWTLEIATHTGRRAAVALTSSGDAADVDGSAGWSSPTGSPPCGAHAPGSTATTEADLLPRPTPGGVTAQNGTLELTRFDATRSVHAASRYTDVMTVHEAPVGSPQLHGVQSRPSSTSL